jgi:hypothetical protein
MVTERPVPPALEMSGSRGMQKAGAVDTERACRGEPV